MRKISGKAVVWFMGLILGPLGVGGIVGLVVGGWSWLGPFAGVVGFVCGGVAFFCAAAAVYRVFFRLRPLPLGTIEHAGPESFTYDVYLLFFLLVFYPVILSRSVPVPVMRLVYLLLGAKLGRNTYSSGAIMDPLLTQAGENTIIGLNAIVSCHTIEGPKITVAPVKIGNGVTVGGNTVVLPGVEIGDGAVVGINSVVPKHTRIGPGEVWAGNPARRIR